MGVPQGGVISPLVANLYMNRFLKYWHQTGRGEAWDAHVINYADDFVILSRGHAAEALAWTDAVMTRLGLTLNRTKTQLCDARSDRYDFLGYSFGPHCHRQQGRRFIGASPSNKSVQCLKDKLGAIPRLRKGKPGTGQQGTVGGSSWRPEPLIAGMVRLLQPWNLLRHGSRDRGPFV
jgi:RNA-directed DNA polymerase